MTDITAVLVEYFSDSVWMLEGFEYSGLSWHSDDKKPTEEEINSLWEELVTKRETEAIAAEELKIVAMQKLEALGLTVSDLQIIMGA